MSFFTSDFPGPISSRQEALITFQSGLSSLAHEKSNGTHTFFIRMRNYTEFEHNWLARYKKRV